MSPRIASIIVNNTTIFWLTPIFNAHDLFVPVPVPDVPFLHYGQKWTSYNGQATMNNHKWTTKMPGTGTQTGTGTKG
jgi:hypothetical protein